MAEKRVDPDGAPLAANQAIPPTPEEIDALCAKIRSGWSKAARKHRKCEGYHGAPVEAPAIATGSRRKFKTLHNS